MGNVILGRWKMCMQQLQSWLLECERWKGEWTDLFQSLSRISLGFDLMTKVFTIQDVYILKIILKMQIVLIDPSRNDINIMFCC